MVMKPTVYIETTIPSYYCDQRIGIGESIARTRQWWDLERNDYECFISPVVLDELEAGNYPTKDACLALTEDIPMLAIVSEVLDIADVYQDRGLMPGPPVRDALHLAIASYYRLDYLPTWNCKHLANANKFRHLEIINQSMGLSTPLLVTPEMLQPWEQDNER
jgi:predicted nucleic acid-binding protein